MSNTHPSTPFGKFFHSIGLWHPDLNGTIEEVYAKLHVSEQEAIRQASGFVAIVNDNIDKIPSEVFVLIEAKYPDITKEYLTGKLNALNAELIKGSAKVPTDFDGAMTALQGYLSQYKGNTWAAISKAVAAIFATILNPDISSIQKVELVLEYVYQTFVKGSETAIAGDQEGIKADPTTITGAVAG